MKKDSRRITDAVAGDTGLARFESATAQSGGKLVRFRMQSGHTYDVPVAAIPAWFEGYEDEQPGAMLCEVPESEVAMIDGACWVEGRIARVSLNDGRIFDIPWDTLLMACEPEFEHYGGLTAASRQLTKRLADEYGSFRMPSVGNNS